MSRKIKPGTKVIVNKNLYREEELHERIDKLPPKPECPTITDEMTLEEKHYLLDEYFKDIRKYRREYVPYASKGETGVIIEEFAIKKYRQGVVRYYKVKIDGKIKTLRQGSIEVVNS